MLKMCISCGNKFEEDEVEEHKESNDCPCIDMVQAAP